MLKQLVSIKQSKIILITRQEPGFYNVIDERENKVVKIKIEAWDFTHTKMMLEVRGIGATDKTLEKIHGILYGYPQYLNLFCILAERNTAEKLLEKLPTALKDAHEYLEKEVYDSLTSDEKLLLQTIAVFRNPETVDAFDSVNKFGDINETLDNLIHKFLVNEIGINTFSVHDILRDYYLSDVSRKKILRSYHELAANYYLSLDDDPEHVLEAAYHFDDAGRKEKSAEVIINKANDFIAKGFWEKVDNQLKSAIIAFHRKTQPRDIQLVALAHLNIGDLYKEKGDANSAMQHALKAIQSFRKIRNMKGIFDSNILIGHIHHLEHNSKQAKEDYEKCLKMAESQKNEGWRAIALGNLANLLEKEDKDKKLDYYFDSLKIFENDGDKINIAASYGNIAIFYKEVKNFEKSYEFIKMALELQKERNAVYQIARMKAIMADIYYNDPKKPCSVDSILNCLKEAFEIYEKIGHVRGKAAVLTNIGDIYRKEEDLKSAYFNYQKALTIYSSLNQQSEETRLNLLIGICFTKLKDFHNAKSYFEKNILSGHSGIEDKLSLIEVFLNIGAYNQASDLSNNLITENVEKNSDDIRFLAHLFLSISLLLSNKIDDAYSHLKKIGETSHQKVNIDWDFSDIEPVLDKTGDSKQFFIDAITFLKGETNYPIIRLKHVKIISEEVRKQAEVFHPFTGSLIITKDDENLKEIMQELSPGKEIDLDTPEIMRIKRDKALLTFGFLFKKGFLDCKNLNKQKFDLRLTDRGLKILRLSKAGG